MRGKQYVYPALAGCAVGLRFGRTPDEIRSGLKIARVPGARMRPVSLGDEIVLLEDYSKGNLESLLAGLAFLDQAPAKRKIVVTGKLSHPVGGYDAAYHELGVHSGRIADLLLVVGPASQSAIRGARESGMPSEAIIDCQGSIHKAAQVLKENLQPGDVVYLKSKAQTQFKRITLLLKGKQVSCRVWMCDSYYLDCEKCSQL